MELCHKQKSVYHALYDIFVIKSKAKFMVNTWDEKPTVLLLCFRVMAQELEWLIQGPHIHMSMHP